MTSIFRRAGRAGFTLKFQDHDGRWRMRKFRTRTEAQDAADRIERSGSAQGQLFRDYAAAWLSRAALVLRRGSIQNYRHCLDGHLLPVFGHLPLEQVTAVRIRDLLAEKLAAGLARNTVNGIRAALRTCLQEACDDGLLPANPARGRFGRLFARESGEDEDAEIKALDAGQLAQFFAAADRVLATDHRLMFRLMSLTGLRLGETLAVQWEDVDLEAGTALIRRGIARGVVQRTKTGRQRTVYLAAGLTQELAAHDVESKAIALQRGAERVAWVFPSETGRHYSHQRLQRAFRRAIEAAKLPPHYTPHCLRHSYASLMLSGGKSVYYVQRQLGHSNIGMTADLYGRWLPAGDRGSANWLEAALSPNPVTSRAKQG